MARKDFDRHDPSHHRVDALEYVGHPPFADRVDQVVGAQVELGAAGVELFDLPPIEGAILQESLGELLVGHFVERANAAIGGGAPRPRRPSVGRPSPVRWPKPCVASEERQGAS